MLFEAGNSYEKNNRGCGDGLDCVGGVACLLPGKANKRTNDVLHLRLERRPLSGWTSKGAGRSAQARFRCAVEDVWDYLREKGYRNQFEGDWQALHIEKPFAGRALTAQYMPLRADMEKAIAAEGKAEGRVSFNNSWPINELQIGDVYVADGMGKIIDGTLIGSNLGNGIAAHTHTGFVFYGGIRDQEENREIPDFNGFYKGYDPSFLLQMTLTAINAPVRIGRAIVLPGDLVLAKTDGVIFIPAIMAEGAVSHAEFTNLMDAYNFELNKEGKNGAEFEGGWTPAKFQGLGKWVDAHPEMLKMPRSEFDQLLADALKPRQPRPPAGTPEP